MPNDEITHSDEVKRVRRKIEDKLRKELSENQIVGLAMLLDINITQPKENIYQKIKS